MNRMKTDCTHNEAGFTLIEVLVAILIFGIACAASLNLMGWSVRANAFSLHITEAVNSAQDKMEDLLAQGQVGIAAGSDTVGIYQRSWTTNYQGMADAFSVAVSWIDIAGNTHSVSVNNIVD